MEKHAGAPSKKRIIQPQFSFVFSALNYPTESVVSIGKRLKNLSSYH
jgi:hypothetical protein